jgi:hypothetical protein
MHRYLFVIDEDGDYLTLCSWGGDDWIEHTRWLIPGTQIED